MQDLAIETNRLTRRYDGLPALNRVSIQITSGSRIALLGNNGSGKTTLLTILSTLLQSSEGSATILGYDVAKKSTALRNMIGFIRHQPMLYENFSPVEDLELFAKIYRVSDAREQIRRLLTNVGIWHLRDEAIGTFSRGQKQRLMIAKALLHKPKVLLLDEPEIGLDQSGLRVLDELILMRKEEDSSPITVLAATHREERVDTWATGFVRLERGQIIETTLSENTE
ncbi:MAG TPA: ABC transporter ATP-binding protein [Dehalococcoidia bacterium]|nr:ABC transporter ATP-binding protein [Dehalococcoidia bacterium]